MTYPPLQVSLGKNDQIFLYDETSTLQDVLNKYPNTEINRIDLADFTTIYGATIDEAKNIKLTDIVQEPPEGLTDFYNTIYLLKNTSADDQSEQFNPYLNALDVLATEPTPSQTYDYDQSSSKPPTPPPPSAPPPSSEPPTQPEKFEQMFTLVMRLASPLVHQINSTRQYQLYGIQNTDQIKTSIQTARKQNSLPDVEADNMHLFMDGELVTENTQMTLANYCVLIDEPVENITIIPENVMDVESSFNDLTM